MFNSSPPENGCLVTFQSGETLQLQEGVDIFNWANFIATFPAGWEFPQMVVKSKGSVPPKCTRNSGLGNIRICPENNLKRAVIEKRLGSYMAVFLFLDDIKAVSLVFQGVWIPQNT